MNVAETARLRLRWLDDGDATFILRLVNEPSWIRYIGDRNVRSVEDAQRYLREGPVAMYERLGFGLNLVESKATGEPLGICGLLRRDTLEHVDLGFAFVPGAWGQGYAQESAAAVLEHGRRELGVGTIVAIVSPDNERSCRLLGKLGFRLDRRVRLAPGDDELALYVAAARGACPGGDAMAGTGS